MEKYKAKMKLKLTGYIKQSTKVKVTSQVRHAIWKKKTLNANNNINNK